MGSPPYRGSPSMVVLGPETMLLQCLRTPLLTTSLMRDPTLTSVFNDATSQRGNEERLICVREEIRHTPQTCSLSFPDESQFQPSRELSLVTHGTSSGQATASNRRIRCIVCRPCTDFCEARSGSSPARRSRHPWPPTDGVSIRRCPASRALS